MLHDEKFDRKKIKIADAVSFLMGFTQAIIVYIISSYFKTVSGTENVGTFYIIAYLIALFCLLNLHRIIRKIGKTKTYYFSLLFKIVAIAVLSLILPSKLGMVMLMLYVIGSTLEWVCLDIILESFSEDKRSGRIRGLHLTVINAGFILGPIISTRILDVFSFQGVFSFCLVLNSLVLLAAIIGFRHSNHYFREDISIIKILKKVITRKDVLRVYSISFVLEFFYAIMVIYSPIYLRDLGYSWDQIGQIFSVMLIAFVIVQYPMGLLADKRTGEKEFLYLSIFIMGVSTISIYFIGEANIAAWTAILFITRIGAALTEVLKESYFYKRVDKNDVDIIDFFRTSSPAAYIFASILASFVLFFFSIKSLFILSGIIILAALYPAFRLINNKIDNEIAKE